MKILKIIVLVFGSISFIPMTQARDTVIHCTGWIDDFGNCVYKTVPKGSYLNDGCRGCWAAAGSINCECVSPVGPILTTITYWDCPDDKDIKNCGGMLKCTNKCP